MIQGYAIYERTLRDMDCGPIYVGSVRSSKPNFDVQKACERRWKQEDRKGICGHKGNFDSRIIYSELRSDAPEMSEKQYRIRVAVDEHHAWENVPEEIRLNKIDPLIQSNLLVLNEEILRLAGRIGGLKNKENRVGFFAMTPEQKSAVSRNNGRKTFKALNANPEFAKAHSERMRARYSNLEFAKAHSERMKVRRADPEFIKRHLESLKVFNADPVIAKAFLERTKVFNHTRWHVNRGIIKEDCELCQNLPMAAERAAEREAETQKVLQ